MTASINRQEALHQFKLALKAGQKCYRDCVHRGRDLADAVQSLGALADAAVKAELDGMVGWVGASWRARSPRSSG